MKYKILTGTAVWLEKKINELAIDRWYPSGQMIFAGTYKKRRNTITGRKRFIPVYAQQMVNHDDAPGFNEEGIKP